ncbi:hypothetical protein ETD86_30105 [Nonomuraea turkmeniaca]|uniref:Uncharacterized protein n=1 Tax=Nonomuraea turkmeniaca TaxID=103838 RepID=A0A5S4FUG2_9ACTN|nr:hypothetical protein [Nonomuraea turkmeniaca]TMR13820.1 hypothetical protein ETD86_30105 [Nonomuraea turkmeniaca]
MPNWYSQQRLNKIPVVGLVPETSGAEPAEPVPFQMWGDSGSGRAKWRTPAGTWIAFDDVRDGAITDAKIAASAGISLSKLAVNPLARSAHTGTQPASTISDFVQQVRATRLDQMAAPTADIALAGYRLTGLGAPMNPSDAARLADVQAAAAGISVKPAVRVATTTNIALSGLQQIDGVTLQAGDRVLVKDQTDASQNGLYVAAADAWQRTGDLLAPNTFVFVSAGTAADTGWAISNDEPITVNASPITWAQFTGGGTGGVGAGAGLVQNGQMINVAAADASIVVTDDSISVGLVSVAQGGTGATTPAGARAALGVGGSYAADLPALSAGEGQAITHNLGTKDVAVSFFEVATGADVHLDVVDRPDANTITVRSDIPVGAGAIRVLVRS